MVGNEYALGLQLQLTGGVHCWVTNVYLPPAMNLVKKGITEGEACSFVEDILSEVPSSQHYIVCGDFNARVKDDAPVVGDVQLKRTSLDSIRCARAPWLISTC